MSGDPGTTQQDRWRRTEAALAGKVICTRCGATLETYSDQCSAALDDTCPGFIAIEEAAHG